SSIKYTLKTKGSRDYEIGDRIDWGVSTTYQLTPKNKFPNFAPVGEINVRQLFRDKQDENDLRNSGSTTVFVSPGFNVGITKNFGVNTSFSIPVYQKTLGRQQETDYQASVGFNFNF
ncbi:MAG: autotransporter outer membrane beta-barrel domain-containing protein, partial [Candidatus Scalindua sp.]|nr:autotransporter outer membrane beta-barrel domain-containing protein [Candidatus Scalindua sp.]